MEVPLDTLKKFRKNVSRRGWGKSHSAKKLERRDPSRLCNGFVLHARGFGCVQNQILSKNAQCTKSGTYSVCGLTKKKEKN